MKNKKIIIIGIVLLVVIASAIVGTIYFLGDRNGENNEEYNEIVQRFEGLEKIANEVNNAIEQTVTQVQAFINDNPSVRRQ